LKKEFLCAGKAFGFYVWVFSI